MPNIKGLAHIPFERLVHVSIFEKQFITLDIIYFQIMELSMYIWYVYYQILTAVCWGKWSTEKAVCHTHERMENRIPISRHA